MFCADKPTFNEISTLRRRCHAGLLEITLSLYVCVHFTEATYSSSYKPIQYRHAGVPDSEDWGDTDI